ncbi:hypothetical protein [uncultured Sphingomonas sp.]|uniref:hypothetical protein n=1 Tax=uncultured Sphingomonas sp. TaxID=158754 RepID=UPI0025FAF307|nr:hypothetical protein [uncultured Sphingomonas sp.]
MAAAHYQATDLASFVAAPGLVARWIREAVPGDVLVYARGEHLPPKSATAALVRKMLAAHKVGHRQRRQPDGRTDYEIRRKAPVRSGGRRPSRTVPVTAGPALDAKAMKVLRYLRIVAKAGDVCPPYATIGRITGIGTAEQARYAERKLRTAGKLTSELVDVAHGLRVVTFDDGLSTRRPTRKTAE